MNKDYLWKKLGRSIQAALLNPNITEIILNPDLKLWIRDKTRGDIFCEIMSELHANAFVYALAQFNQQYLNQERPYLDCCLPFHGERVNVTVPPVTDKVSFNIRKKANTVFTLDDYVCQKVMTTSQAQVLREVIQTDKNILVSGGPGSGKTTLINTLLNQKREVVSQGHRVLLLEQVPEIESTLQNTKRLLTTETVDLRKLLWLAMRNSPDSIVVGEVRDGAALDCLKAWNTGCRGGMATIHANHPEAAIQRMLDLASEVSATPPYRLLAETLDVIVQIDAVSKHPARRQVSAIVEVTGYSPQTQHFQCRSL